MVPSLAQRVSAKGSTVVAREDNSVNLGIAMEESLRSHNMPSIVLSSARRASSVKTGDLGMIVTHGS